MFYFFLKLFKERSMLKSLIINDLKTRYQGSILGILWAFVNPLATVGVLWFVFSMGFKAKPIGDHPYLIWLFSGMIPWFFLSDSILTATSSVIEKSFLVKKIVFDVSLLPMVKIGSSLVVHFFFIGFLFLIFIASGFFPKLIWLQIFYYIFCSLVLVQALSWLTSSIVIFIRDLGQVVGVVIQFGFWLTPVFWSYQTVPEKYQIFIHMNPFFYIVNGFRETMIEGKWFWESPGLSLYFWIFTLIIFLLGAKVFDRLRPHFADVI